MLLKWRRRLSEMAGQRIRIMNVYVWPENGTAGIVCACNPHEFILKQGGPNEVLWRTTVVRPTTLERETVVRLHPRPCIFLSFRLPFPFLCLLLSLVCFFRWFVSVSILNHTTTCKLLHSDRSAQRRLSPVPNSRFRSIPWTELLTFWKLEKISKH
jgi:hypothetical protein